MFNVSFMAPKKCKACGRSMGNNIARCPSCGAITAKFKRDVALFTAILLFFGAIVATAFVGPNSSSSPAQQVTRAKEPDVYDAWTAAKQFVKDSLKAPSTASFGGMFDQSARDNTTRLADGTFVVKIWVDAQNSFGATVRTHFTVRLRYKGNDTWALAEPLQPIQR